MNKIQTILLALLIATAGCKSQVEKDYEAAKRKQQYYNSPEFKAKQKEILDQTTGGFDDAVRKYNESQYHGKLPPRGFATPGRAAGTSPDRKKDQ